ncbi:MAG: adenylate/guanylate cyclase domain-containing protein [Archangium sp.]|nr:adenylate/guanylate cyclase domain-containing protein [Archangium sp.]
MKALLSKWRYEAFALLVFAVFGAMHLFFSVPLLGLQAVEKGGSVHSAVQSLDGRVTNLLFKIRGEQPAHDDVVVVEIDERGSNRYGLWPWPREVIADAIEKLLDLDARVVGLDISFNNEAPVNVREKEWLAALQAGGALSPELEAVKTELTQRTTNTPDDRLEAALKRGGQRVVQGTIPYGEKDLLTTTDAQRAQWAESAKSSVITSVPGKVKGSFVPIARVKAYPFVGVFAPLPRFAATGSPIAHFATIPDVDSTIRRSPLLLRLDQPEGLLPSLALAVAAKQLDAQIFPDALDNKLNHIVLRTSKGDVVVPVEGESPMTLINYPGADSAFHRLSIVDVLDGKVKKEDVAGKAILVGVTIVGSTGDQRVTPFSEFTGGIYTHASVVSNVLRGDFMARPDWLNYLELVLMAVLGLGMGFATPRLKSFTRKSLLLVAVVLGYSLVTYALFTKGLKVDWVVPTLQLVVTAFGTIFLGYLSVDREKLKMRSTFSRYLGEEVMDVALENPDRLNRGEKREMTVLFSDIRGFTSLSEHMSPEKLADFINQYLSPMTQIVFDEKGTLDKYIGDAVMAFWNAPLDQPDHALRACRAAVHMLARLEELKLEWRKAGYPELEIGIGINTGQMVVGNMGSDVRVDYTVLGDSVNLGSRLEGTTKEYEVRTIISESTRAAVKDGIVTRRLGAVRVKGKKVPVGIYELRALGTPSETDAQAIALFETGLAAWTARKFDEAEARFKEVLALWPSDGPTRNYLAELEDFRANPPPADWDGVVSLKTK